MQNLYEMRYLYSSILFITVLFFSTCNESVTSFTEVSTQAKIFPEYEGTYIPYNIAPINFQIRENGTNFMVRVASGADSFEVFTKKDLNIPLKKWKSLLESHKGEEMRIQIFAKENNNWKKFNDMIFLIAEEPVDPYIAYRLIEPGYAAWNHMGLFQRCLENFEETPILLNTMTDKNCMNCHSFHQYNPDRVLFHVRGKHAGTILAKDGEVKKLNTKADWMMSAGVYPRWHPEGRYIAFSTNQTTQGFLTAHANKIEVYDKNSDIVIYDTEADRIFKSDILFSKNRFETFPEWSPDGKYLYFCSAEAKEMPVDYQSMKYDLLRVAFDSKTGTFSNGIDTLVSSFETNKSVSMPRVSPDGKYLVFCHFDYGTFPIWHKENDLYQLDLENGEFFNMSDVNSNESDSYHSWSSNGRWILFSSRRMDGNYTRLYIAYFDKNGKGHKPILLPQKNTDYYDFQMKSYNVPEFISGKVGITPAEFSDIVKGEAIIPNS